MMNYNTFYGILFMLINTLALAGLDIAAKTLGGTLDASLIVFIYKFSLFVIILPWVFREGLLRVKTHKLHLHICRSLLSVAGALCFFRGLSLVHMSDAAALENIQYVIVSIIGIIFFKERCTAAKLIAVFLGFVGAVIVANPDLLVKSATSSSNGAYWFIILAICFWSCNTIMVKLLGNTEHNKTQMLYLLFFASIFSFHAAFIHWNQVEIAGHLLPLMPSMRDLSSVNITINHISLLAVMAACYFVHGVAYFSALKSELSIVIPFRYTKLIFSGLFGYLFFGEQPQAASYIGYVLIVLGGFILFRAQMQKNKLA